MSVAAPPKHECDRCGRISPRVCRTDTGGLCRACYRNDPAKFVDCAQCGRRKRPSTRTADGRALCNNCARPKHECVACGRVDHAKVIAAAGPLCQRCYAAPTRPCGQCGETRPIAKRMTESGTDLCSRCVSTPARRCEICGTDQPTHVQWPLGPVCQPCYRRTIASPTGCGMCGELRVLVGVSDGTRVCAQCSGSAHHYSCAECGSVGPQHFAETCRPCSVERWMSELLADNGAVPASLSEVPRAFVDRGNAASTLRWLGKPGTQTLLTTIGRQARVGPLTHATLDSCPATSARHYLRAILVDADLLPPRNEPIARLETWIDEYAAQLPANHALIVAPFARWSELRAARRRYDRTGIARSGVDGSARERIRTAVRLIRHLESSGRGLHDLTQSILDEWIGDNRNKAARTVGFIKWLNERGITDDLTVTISAQPLPSETGEEADHVALVTEMLTNGELELSTRVAGLLVLLYAARMHHICELTREDVTADDQGVVSLRLADHPVAMPEPVGVLVQQLVSSSTAAQDEDHLLPGAQPGRPIHTTTLGRKLKAVGISPRVNRNYAMVSLASDLPAAVLATQFGYNITTAMTWSQFAQRDNSAYLRARSNSNTRYEMKVGQIS